MSNVIQLRPEKPPDPDEAARRKSEQLRALKADILRLTYQARDQHGYDAAAKIVTEVSNEVLGL